MKRILAIIVLIFSLQSLTKADDTRDFQIEGMSIGDSLLDYFSEKEIIEEKKSEYNYKNIFATIGFRKNSFENYDKVQFDYKLNDKTYKIYGITGVIYFKDNFKDCLDKKEEIILQLSASLKNIKRQNQDQTHWADKSGDSKTYDSYFNFDSGGYVLVTCYDWSEKKNNENGWFDNLKVGILTQEFQDFLKTTYNN